MTPPADDGSPTDDPAADDGSVAGEDAAADDTSTTDDIPPVDDPTAPESPPADETRTGDEARTGDETPTGDETYTDDSPTQEAASDWSGPSLDVDEYTTGPRSLSPSVQVQWAVSVLISMAIFGVVAGLAARFFDFPLAYVGAGVLVLALLSLVWVHFRHRVWTYRVREDGLYLERGVVTRVDTVVPYVRIQHVDTQRGPLERALGLSTLVVYTAGSRGADVSIPGLTTDEAADLQQRVKDLSIEAEGGDAL